MLPNARSGSPSFRMQRKISSNRRISFPAYHSSNSLHPTLHSFTNSTGKSMPTLLALNLTLSSSLMPMPGLYLSIKVMYVRCAATYCANCSACAICDAVDVFADWVVVWLMVSRMRCCSVEGAESFWCAVREGIVDAGIGSSRRRRR